ncbi:type III-B CRISPR module RAMP protein Cmr6 [Amycolatopsis sp. OK19-0408]|uniref:Type III-B CRISPR module RAMP protein Cmr6 n=1 Tax=Amycolatopsis iheyensis TaxID=2945988 RepID=A0A9X2NL96_9PSEU|nr:type III-B CRISPR module RAMP protein Cmr6 [Amycolatopsis iheyensis]MCR6488387.1 type III-B CRISPR module RAMP protein Cmr6 [Amycolatopsis iheyensis]
MTPRPLTYGSLRDLVTTGETIQQLETQPNGYLLWSRLWCGLGDNGTVADDTERQLQHLEAVAAAARAVPAGLLESIAARRRAAAAALAARDPELVSVEVQLVPQWRVVVGHGENTVHETGLSWSPTYGVPMWPGSGLKGAAAAQVPRRWPDRPDLVQQLFGSPRPGTPGNAGQGAVTILDALPAGSPHVVLDVLTPHGGGYYREVNSGAEVVTPPAEYHNPVPVHFLAVEATPFHTQLIGRATAVQAMVALLTDAAGDWGIGAKTAAGYGYCTVTVVEPS